MRRRTLRPFFIAFFCALCFALPNLPDGAFGAAAPIRIEIPASVRVDGSAFTLGDIAWISAPDAVRDVLSPLVLSVEGEGVVTRDQVIRAIESSGLESVRLELQMPERVLVSSGEGELPAEGQRGGADADETLAFMIKSLAAWDGNVEVSYVGAVPKGQLVAPVGLVPGTPAATLRFREGSGRDRSLAVRLIWTQDVLIMARSVPKGQPLSAADFVTRSIRITRPGVYATRLSEVLGRAPRKSLSQGKPVPLELLSELVAAKKGRTVLIRVRYQGLTATVKGVLLDEGAVGSVVRVRRADNKKVVLKARVLDSDTVEVDVP